MTFGYPIGYILSMSQDPKQLEMFPGSVTFAPQQITTKPVRVPAKQYKTLDPKFLQFMDDVGIYGMDKYGDESFEVKRQQGKLERTMERVEPEVIAKHGCDHHLDAVHGIKHDHFGTIEHNLAASAFNAYMQWAYWEAEQSE